MVEATNRANTELTRSSLRECRMDFWLRQSPRLARFISSSDLLSLQPRCVSDTKNNVEPASTTESLVTVENRACAFSFPALDPVAICIQFYARLSRE